MIERRTKMTDREKALHDATIDGLWRIAKSLNGEGNVPGPILLQAFLVTTIKLAKGLSKPEFDVFEDLKEALDALKEDLAKSPPAGSTRAQARGV